MCLVKTRVEFPTETNGEIVILQLPVLRPEDRLFLTFTLQTVAKIEGEFIVDEVLHTYSTSGYAQHILISPKEV